MRTRDNRFWIQGLPSFRLSRRDFLRALGAGALIGLGPIVEACSPGTSQPAVTPETETPQRGGNLTVQLTADPESLDPHVTTHLWASRTLQMIHDTLVVLDFDGTIKPGLAESWEISPDGLVYTFRLRRGVRFHSGKSFTAADVKYSFERWKTTPRSPTAYNIDQVTAVETPDDYTVVIRLSQPFVLLLDNLSIGWASILNREAVERLGQNYGATGADGTGPFKFVEWTRNQRLILERNPDYTWGPKIFSNHGPAYVDRVEFRIIPEEGTRVAEFEAGNIDILSDVPGVEVFRLEKSANVSVVKYDQLQTAYIGLKTSDPILRDVRVRRALNHATNKEEIISSVRYGLAIPALGVLHPKTWGYWKGIEQAAYKFDPERAKQLLEEAGWRPGPDGIRQKDGQRLKLNHITTDTQAAKLQAQVVQEQWRRVGVELEIRSMESAAFFAALRAGEHQTFAISVFYSNADVLYFYFHSRQRPAPNRFDWADPKTDGLLERSRSTLDETQRLQIYEELQRIVHENALWVPLTHDVGVVGVSRRTGGVKVHPSNWLYKFLDIYVKTGQR